jgi:8-oxo-dGTP diphosphatase
MKRIRNSAKAIIVRDGCLLATHNVDEYDDWYLLPGGGQEFGETLGEAVLRECQEELGATVQVGRLRAVREYIGGNHEFAETDGDTHQVEFMFECTVDETYEPRNGRVTDTYQVGVVWLPLSSLDDFTFYPATLKAFLASDDAGASITYWGDVN